MSHKKDISIYSTRIWSDIVTIQSFDSFNPPSFLTIRP